MDRYFIMHKIIYLFYLLSLSITGFTLEDFELNKPETWDRGWKNEKIYFENKIKITDLSLLNLVLCSGINNTFLNSTEEICVEIKTDYSKEDKVLFIAKPQINLNQFKYNYLLEIENFNFTTRSLIPDSNTFKFDPTEINTVINNGILKQTGYKEYHLKDITHVNIQISIDLMWKKINTPSTDAYITHYIKQNSITPIKNIISTKDSEIHSISSALCFLTDGSKVVCLGRNLSGETGVDRPVRLLGGTRENNSISISEASFIDFGIYDPSTFQALKVIQVITLNIAFCALFENGHVKCWGANGRPGYTDKDDKFGFIGMGEFSSAVGDEAHELKNAQPIMFDEPITKLYSNAKTVCGQTVSNKLKCWGENKTFGLAQGLQRNEYITTQQNLFDLDYISISSTKNLIFAGPYTICSIGVENEIYCWGYNSYDEQTQRRDRTVPDIRQYRQIFGNYNVNKLFLIKIEYVH